MFVFYILIFFYSYSLFFKICFPSFLAIIVMVRRWKWKWKGRWRSIQALKMQKGKEIKTYIENKRNAQANVLKGNN